MVAIVLLALGVVSGPGLSADDLAREAIIDAVRLRMGAGVDVVIESLVVTGAEGTDGVRAVPEPDARLGTVMHFTLQSADGAAPIGSASARISVVVPHMHAVQPLDRGVDVTEDDVVAVSHVVAAGPLRAWPGEAATLGAKVVRALAAGACVSRAAIQAVQAVRVGQQVTAVAHIGGVEASAVMVAAGSGDPGAVIRVVNRQSRRALKARIVSAGLVEIIK